MEYKDINTIKEDPNNPRKKFDENHIAGLARSIMQEGVINPIEIDEKGIIITGHCRYRACKLLKMTTVPVNINGGSYDEYERLRHQIAENVHQSGLSEQMMNPIDTANAYKRLLDLMWKKDSEATSQSTISRQDKYGKKAVEKLATEIGISNRTVYDYLEILDEPQYVQKDIEAGRARTFYKAVKNLPKELQDEAKKKIAKGGFSNRDEVRQLVTTTRHLPDLAVLDLERNQAKESTETNQILNGVSRLALALERQPLNEVSSKEQGIVHKQLQWISKKIIVYLAE